MACTGANSLLYMLIRIYLFIIRNWEELFFAPFLFSEVLPLPTFLLDGALVILDDPSDPNITGIDDFDHLAGGGGFQTDD